jgi:hypothetical protein
MLVKVGLSYYMEGEHRQGAKAFKGVCPGTMAGGAMVAKCKRR